MVYHHDLPKRVRVLILGGGIHGVGLLHDLASRGFKDIFLVEKNTLASGTSSRSTKLIHGGLRYLKRLSDFPLVTEALKERKLLIELAPDIVSPLEFFFPILPQGGERAWMVKIGLSLYDTLAGSKGLQKHRLVDKISIHDKVPLLNTDKVKAIYSFWDGQTDDLALVLRVAASAVQHGGKIAELCQAHKMTPSHDGWEVEVTDAQGRCHTISALYVVNCLGPWANTFLQANGITPTHKAVKNKGTHLILPDKGLKAGLFLQSPEDKRIFFLLPWQGHTLLGTTEGHYQGNPDHLQVEEEEVDYLLRRCNPYLRQALSKREVLVSFAGLRWLAVEKSKSISATSREYVIGEHPAGRGLLLTIYGGKLTCYRALAEKIGDRIASHFGEFLPSQTANPQFWLPAATKEALALPSIYERFAAP